METQGSKVIMTIDTNDKAMEKRRLGRTEYQVTSLGLGTY